MKINNPLLTKLTQPILVQALVLALICIGCATPPNQATELSHQRATSGTIQVEFKLDPRLTSGLYMGERWVSPPTYDTVQPGAVFTVEARAQVMDNNGYPTQLALEWIPADPALVEIISGQGNQVTIVVHSAGETNLTVTSGGISKKFVIKATNMENAIRVQIKQLEENNEG